MIVISLDQAAPAGAQFPLSAAVAAVVSVVVFWLGHVLTRRTARKERQRQVIEDWFRTLSKWVDDYGHADSNPNYAYYTLTNRQVIELSLTRKNRYLAWWMHEMALAVVKRRRNSKKSWDQARSSVKDLRGLLTEAGEYLLAWHHGELRSSDFLIPYKLRSQARTEDVDVEDYAKGLNLEKYVKPKRMSFRRSWEYQRLLFRPHTGAPILESLEGFTGRRYIKVAILFTHLSRLATLPRYLKLQLKLANARARLRRSERRLKTLETLHARLESRHDANDRS